MATCLVIYGTWGEESDFAFVDSLFCRAIKAASNQALDFQRFQWSGKNSSLKRHVAALRLRDVVAGFPVDHLPLYLIAHSHGGNVAVEALTDAKTAARVAGLVTMGTPFVSQAMQPWVSFLNSGPGSMGFYAIVMGIVMGGVVGIVGSVIRMVPPFYGFVAAFALAALFFAAWQTRHGNVLGNMTNALNRASRSILIASKQKVEARILVVHTPMDEALWWLRHIVSASNLPFMLVNLGLIITAWSMILGMGLVMLFQFVRLLVSADRIDWLMLPMFGSMALGVVLLAVGAVAALVAKVALRFFGTGEAVERWSGILTRTRATRMPQNVVVELTQFQAPLERFRGGLWHSKFMRSGLVADHIAEVLDRWQPLDTSCRAGETLQRG